MLCCESSSAHDEWCCCVPAVGKQPAGRQLLEGTGAVEAVCHAEHAVLCSSPVAVRGGLLGIVPTIPYA
jgi:hypothetical protein|eukprot:COSAG02_NODE_3665_length_6391_cov_9.381406_1_plen_69_part_00